MSRPRSNPNAVRVYVTAPSRDIANAAADTLKAAGHHVCSLWHRHPGGVLEGDSLYAFLRHANDEYFVKLCEVLIVMSVDSEEAGEALEPWEVAYAIRMDKRIVRVNGMDEFDSWIQGGCL